MRNRKPRYADEDTEPTSEKELKGWYSYCIAAEVFAVSGVGSFLPVTLEQLARERGVLRSDGTTSCIEASHTSLRPRENAPCIVRLFGANVNTSSFALYTFSIAVSVQVLVLISTSAIADHGSNRKRLLLTLGLTGAVACMLFIVVFPAIYLVGSLLAVISVTCLGNTFALLNSFLPLLVANHPSVAQSDYTEEGDNAIHLRSLPSETNARRSDDFDGQVDERETFSITPHEATDRKSRPAASTTLKLSSDISSKCVGIGYAAGVLAQIISIVILITFSKLAPRQSKTTIPMRLVLLIVGAWWATFTIPTALWLRRRPGPPLPVNLVSRSRSRWTSWMHYIAFAWSSLWKTMKLAAQLRQALTFLIAWFLLSDAVATVSGSAILFARTELQMKTEALAGLSITATMSGIVGAYCWPVIARKFGLQPKIVIILCISLFELIPVYGLLGFIPFVKAWGVGGLQQQWEIFPLGFILGFVMGGLNTYCRSVFSILIPPSKEAAFFALYAVTDKGSSIFGPAIVGRIVDSSGSIRVAFWFLAALILLPIPVVWLVDVPKGQQEALGKLSGLSTVHVDRIARDDLGSDDRQESEGLLERNA